MPPRPREQYRKEGFAAKAKEGTIQKAVDGVKDGTYANCGVAARVLGIPEQYKTIWRRLNGKTRSRAAAHMTSQLLNSEQEQVLVNWIKFLGRAGIPLSKRTIAPKVTALCGRKPSRRWIYRFLRRHPDCLLGRPAGLDSKRARAFNFTTVQHHFRLMQNALDNDGNPIPDRNVFNFDEIGIQIGGGRKGSGEQYFYAQGDQSKYKINSDDLELVTVIETICADGTALIPPCFVFSGVNMCAEWFEEGHPDDPKWEGEIIIATTENGWTNDLVCATWFEKGFIPAAKARCDAPAPTFVIFDSHHSHITIEMADLAIANNIILFCLPPHTTHRLQPCDVGGFGPLKKHWIIRCEAVLTETGDPMKAKDVVREYLAARRAAFKAETIIQAWAKSGIDVDLDSGELTCNPDRFTAADFAPSISTSTQLHMPEGYPERPASPSSSEGGSDDEPSSSEDEGGDDWQDVTSVHPPRHRATLPSSSSATVPNATPPPPPPTSSGAVPSSPQPLPAFTNLYNDSDDDSDEDPPSAFSTPAKIAHYRARNQKLKARITRTRGERDTAATHAILAGDHIKALQTKLNLKQGTASAGSGGRVVHTLSRILTLPEGREAAEQQKEARDDKNEKAADRQARKEDAAAATRARRAKFPPALMTFTGTLKQQKVGELKDLAWALSLDEQGTKDVLLSRIQTHLDLPANVALKTDKRYVALFRVGKRKRAADDSEDEGPGPSTSPQRRRLDDIGNISPARRPQTPQPSGRANQAALHPPTDYPPTLPRTHSPSFSQYRGLYPPPTHYPPEAAYYPPAHYPPPHYPPPHYRPGDHPSSLPHTFPSFSLYQLHGSSYDSSSSSH